MTHFKGLFDTQLHIELLQCIAAYQSQGIQVSDLLPPFIRNTLACFAPQYVPSLFPPDPAHDVWEQSLEALHRFTHQGWIALTHRGAPHPADAHDPDTILTRAGSVPQLP